MASAIDQHVQSALSEGYWDIAESPAEETAPSASSAKPRLKSLRRKVSKVFSAAERKTAVSVVKGSQPTSFPPLSPSSA